MPWGHGQAERLLLEGDDREAFDRLLEGDEAERRTLLNRFLGPGRFGRMFPDLKPFRATRC